MACFDAWDIGACGCGPPVCNYTFCATGLTGSALAGALIYIYTNSGLGTLVGSGTTDSTGCCTINIGATGTYWEVITATGFNTWSGSVTGGSCGGTQTPIPLATANQGGGTGGGLATGYHPTRCNQPASSLTVSIPAMSYTGTATWNSAWNAWQTACIGPYPSTLYYHVMLYFPAKRQVGSYYYDTLYWTFYWPSQCPNSPASGTYGTANITCNPLHVVAVESDGTVYWNGP
jgi:hypothetical protein